MLHQATREIARELSHTTLKYETVHADGQSEVRLPFVGSGGLEYTIRLISVDEDNDVSVRVYGLMKLGRERCVRVLPVLNYLNSSYRFIKFVCDRDGNVNVEYDYPVGTEDPAYSAEEMVECVSGIIGEAYPLMCRAIGDE